MWRWNIKVWGEGLCLPAPTVLNISQFLTDQEMEGGFGEPHWFVVYSCMLQRVGEAALRKEVGCMVRGPEDQSLTISACLLA